MVADCLPAGHAGATGQSLWRSPLADVADMAVVAAPRGRERGRRTGPRSGAASSAGWPTAWEARNRRAFLAGYLDTAGIAGLVPTERDVVRDLVAVFELERAARRAAHGRRATGV